MEAAACQNSTDRFASVAWRRSACKASRIAGTNISDREPSSVFQGMSVVLTLADGGSLRESPRHPTQIPVIPDTTYDTELLDAHARAVTGVVERAAPAVVSVE